MKRTETMDHPVSGAVTAGVSRRGFSVSPAGELRDGAGMPLPEGPGAALLALVRAPEAPDEAPAARYLRRLASAHVRRLAALGEPGAPAEFAPLAGEPHVAELPDGELYALIRADYAKNALMRQTRSTDGGKTWEPIAPTPLSGLPPHLLVLKDGRLLAAYGRRTNDRGGFGEYASHSSDGGRTWDCEVKLSGATNDDLGYPASVELDDGAILTVYYQQPPEGGKSCIMATKWKPVR